MQQERLVESWFLRKKVEARILANALRGLDEPETFEATASELLAGGFSVEYE